jgi:tetratricopeptide (TPR) repeat protein
VSRIAGVRGAIAFALVATAVPRFGEAQAVSGGSWEAQFETARQLVDKGSLNDAQTIFETATQATDPSTRAYGFFGRAFVMQQRLTSGDMGETTISVDSVLAEYTRAELLDPAGVGILAHNNAGTLLRAVGRRDDAAGEFIAAAVAGQHPDRATFYLSAAIELAARTPQTTSSRDSSMWAIREALALAPTRADVLSTYSQMLAERLPAGNVIDSLASWRGDTLRAEFAADALSSLLIRAEPAVSENDAARALVGFAETLPVIQISPGVFDAKYRGRIEAMAKLHPTTADGGHALLDAMSQHVNAPFQPGSASRWWTSTSSSTESSRAAWSSLLRWMGDWYYQRDSRQLAQQFYEAALGGGGSVYDRWVDRRALAPLGLIYVAEGDKSSSAKLQENVQRFTDILFHGKAAAYARGDVAEIRDFHLALATIYAKKGQWTSNGADNAQYQIEHLREATATLETQTHRPESVPPDLLAKLAIHYRQTGRTAEADRLKTEIRTQYRRQGRLDAGEQVIKHIDTETGKPDALKPDATIPPVLRKVTLTGVVPGSKATEAKQTVVFSTGVTNQLPAKNGVAHEVAESGTIVSTTASKARNDSEKKAEPGTAAASNAVSVTTAKVGQAVAQIRVSGRLRDAAEHPLPGVDIHVEVGGKESVVRSGLGGTFSLTIPQNTPDIGIKVVYRNERFVGRLRTNSPIEIKLAASPIAR